MSNKKNIIESIKTIEGELESFQKEVTESSSLLDGEKKRIIDEVKSGSFDEMLNEIQERKEKKETFFQKLLKIF
jgi:GTPase involved in cell partitioning and DNA repair